MFKIVASFTRTNIADEFFYDVCLTHDVMREVHANADNVPGYLGIEEVHRDQFKCENALCFADIESFNVFVEINTDLLSKRNEIIAEYCQRTGHVYNYYMIENEDKK